MVYAWNSFGKCHLRASRSGNSSCAATPTVKLLRRDGRPAHGYHGSREHGNERNAGGLHRSGLVRAGTGAGDAHWRDVLMLSAERSKGERGATMLAPCKLRQKQKEVNHGPFAQKPRQRSPRCTVALRWKHQRRNLLACKRRRAVCCVHTVQVHEAGGPKPRPDVQHTPRGAAHAERSACASRGPTAAARCRPDGRARPRRRRRPRMMFGTGACGRGAPG